MGTQLPLSQRGTAPSFRPISVVAKWLNGLRCHLCHLVAYGGRPRPRRLCVRWGTSSSPQKGGRAPPQFSSHVYCGQTAGWIKMALGMEVGLGPAHTVLNGDPTPVPKRGAEPPTPNFRLISIVVKRLDASRCHLVRPHVQYWC